MKNSVRPPCYPNWSHFIPPVHIPTKMVKLIIKGRKKMYSTWPHWEEERQTGLVQVYLQDTDRGIRPTYLKTWGREQEICTVSQSWPRCGPAPHWPGIV